MKKLFNGMFTLLALSLALGLQTTAHAADEATPAYAITDEAVIINHIPYAIENNTIQYEGKTYEVREDDTLVTYDETGAESVLLLPLEKYRVTDPAEIAKLEASLAESKRNSVVSRIFSRVSRSSSISLPYYGYVVQRQRSFTTPELDTFENRTKFAIWYKLWDFSDCSYNDKKFDVTFTYKDAAYNWNSMVIKRNEYIANKVLGAELLTAPICATFTFDNLYGNPSPSYALNIALKRGEV